MCHIPPKKLFKKTQNFEFFLKKGGLRVSKMKILKKKSDLKLASKNKYETCPTSPPKETFLKKLTILSVLKKGGIRRSKNKIFEIFFSDFKLASKNTYETCATSPPTKFFKKLIFLVFSNKGVKGVKK